jgi:hypothetical protein
MDTVPYVDTIPEEEHHHQGSSQDSFIVQYRQKVHGYEVKAVLKPYVADWMVLAADIYFTKKGKTFMLHSNDFGDTIFCKGRFDFHNENRIIVEKYRNETVTADYRVTREKGEFYPRYAPFFFQDMDFDGTPELIIVHQSEAVRFHDGYDVYRLVEDIPLLLSYPPYYNKGNHGFGMTDYPRFDLKKKTITSPLPEGELHYDCYDVYGIAKKKEVVVVNGHKHYFNKIVKKATKQFDEQ